MAHAPGTFSWFECGTTDAAAAKKFYTAVFGWTAIDQPLPGDMPGTYTMLKRGDDDVAGLYELAGPMAEGVPSHWMTYVTVEDVDAKVAKAKDLGGKAITEAMDIPDVGRIAFIEDSTGGKFGIFKPGGHPGAAQLGPVTGTFGWSELATRDTAAAKLFYSELFDWKAKDSNDVGMPYTEWVAQEQHIGGMMEMTAQHGDAPPHWLPYVLVDDCDATMAKVETEGGKTLVPAMDIPTVGRMAVFTDPTGAALAIIKMGASHK